jgi:hypothetical protein
VLSNVRLADSSASTRIALFGCSCGLMLLLRTRIHAQFISPLRLRVFPRESFDARPEWTWAFNVFSVAGELR